MTKQKLTPDSKLTKRFSAVLDRIAPDDSKVGVAVSGGPDSLALLLLAAAARPGKIEAVTVDHALRKDSVKEGEMVADLCKSLGVPHTILTAKWKKKPETAIQERARLQRYRLIADWMKDKGLGAIITAHHLDDQAETLMMRLNRGAGVRGLAGMRPATAIPLPGSQARLLRPLLGWRRSELEDVCKSAGLKPVADPSNENEQFERARIRKALASADWLDPEAVAKSAAYLASADAALHWAVDKEWESQVSKSDGEIVYRPSAPAEVRRRIIRRSVAAFATEGRGNPLRGSAIDRLLMILNQGGKAAVRGVLCSGGEEWRFSPAPKRRQTQAG